MKSKIAAIAFSLVLLGAGCTQPVVSVAQPEPEGMPSPEGFVSFRNGYGKLPGLAPHAAVSSGDSNVSWTADLPTALTEATVIRRRPTLPDTMFLQNVTTALRIPAGALGQKPTVKGTGVAWDDENGYRWTYDAETNHLTFTQTTNDSEGPHTVAILPPDENMLGAAEAFAKAHGFLNNQAWGNPALVFSWNAWWDTERADRRCMTLASLNAIRAQGTSATATPPALPKTVDATCVNPEFPIREIVRFQMIQDGSVVYDAHAVGIPVAEFIIRTDSGVVESGSIEIARDADRSNYPVKAAADIVSELKAGGLTGPLGANRPVVITEFAYALYRHDTEVDGTARTFFIPALLATGDITEPDGAHSPYRTLIPLVKENAYSEQR